MNLNPKAQAFLPPFRAINNQIFDPHRHLTDYAAWEQERSKELVSTKNARAIVAGGPRYLNPLSMPPIRANAIITVNLRGQCVCSNRSCLNQHAPDCRYRKCSKPNCQFRHYSSDSSPSDANIILDPCWINESDIKYNPNGSPIGEGGFGKVFEGEWANQKVAIKEFVCDNPASLSGEVKIMYELRHPNVLSIFGYCRTRSKSLIVMELMDCNLYSCLAGELRVKSPLSLVQKVSILSQAASGLSLLHNKSVIHRDLKSLNILLCISDRASVSAKLCDFGLSTRNAGPKYITAFNALKNPVGTLFWMSPELFQGEAATSCSDVYAFGVVVAEVILSEFPHPVYGQKLFPTIPANEFIQSIMDSRSDIFDLLFPNIQPEQLLSSTINSLLEIVKRCVQRDSKHRPSAAELHRVLTDRRLVEEYPPFENLHLHDSMDDDGKVEQHDKVFLSPDAPQNPPPAFTSRPLTLETQLSLHMVTSSLPPNYTSRPQTLNHNTAPFVSGTVKKFMEVKPKAAECKFDVHCKNPKCAFAHPRGTLKDPLT